MAKFDKLIVMSVVGSWRDLKDSLRDKEYSLDYLRKRTGDLLQAIAEEKDKLRIHEDFLGEAGALTDAIEQYEQHKKPRCIDPDDIK